ncbi:MAG: type I DNA topoisomerase [Glycocaulis sp.]
MTVVVVESPAKAKTINKYLGKDFTVLASFGHVRDLPAKDGSVRPDEDFAMEWEIDSRSAPKVKAIADALKDHDTLILATDPDREGEAISWHLLEALTKRRALKDKTVKRVAFNAITKSAVQDALANPRDVDMELVEAYLARRALDYLVGFTLSPVLWRKLPGARSAGRVQSVALRLITEREGEIERFTPQEYWSIEADVRADGSDPFRARLSQFDGKKITRLTIGDEPTARAAEAAVKSADFTIAAVEAKPTKRNPPAPFTTSTLQQEASRKLGFDAARTMRVAQRLYEGIDIGGETTGLITYMRTDGVSMDGSAIHQARKAIGERYGEEYVPDVPRAYSSKAKNAQEAHEAIRPTSFLRHPSSLRLEADQARLYELIWKRAVASQMESARLERTTIDLEADGGKLALRATGSVVTFDGFFALYREGLDDDADEDGEARLPAVKQGASANAAQTFTEQHFTQPPPRYTEATLVKKMEELGIGRPSTYASVLSVLRDRDYVHMEDKRFVPEDKGRVVIAFLENFFTRYVEYDFTADLEDQLDKVSAGEMPYKELLRRFWEHFSANVEGIADLRVGQVIDAMNIALAPLIFPAREDGKDARLCPSCNEGTLSLRLGKHGAFVGCSNYPDCRYTRPLGGNGEGQSAIEGDGEIGTHPEHGQMIYLKDGRFGPYLEMKLEGEDKPRRSSLPKGWDPASINLEKAVMLIDLPRQIGPHPDDGEMIEAGLGRYGPFVKHGKTYANLPSIDEVFEIGINRAVTLIEDKKANGGRGRASAEPLKELGEHPDGGPIQVMAGRYGPYVKWAKVNATLPKDVTPETVTLEQAVELINAKAGSAKGKRKAPAKNAAAAKKPAAKKAASAKKPAAKKTAASKAKAGSK